MPVNKALIQLQLCTSGQDGFRLLPLIITVLVIYSCTQNPPSTGKKLLIRNGLIVNHDSSFVADILIIGEKITAIGSDIKPTSGTQIIDASGLEVLPGGIDPHVHITGRFVDDFVSGSKAAIAGGITTIGEISYPKEGESIQNRINSVASEVHKSSIVDVMIHPVLASASLENRNTIPQISADGYTSLKFYMVSPAFYGDVSGFSKVIEISKKEGVLPMIHCEDFEVVKRNQDSLITEGKSSILHYAASRPVEAEVKATMWAIQQSETLEAPVYIVHLASAKALDLCRKAQKRGVQVYVETRPMYLYLTEEVYEREDRSLFTAQPPLRSQSDIEALWQGLADGSIHTLGSDHAPSSLARKMNPENNIVNSFAGSSNLQLMLPMVYSEGVRENRISIEKFVELTSTNAAKLFGLFPRKGIIQIGSDADIVIWDKNETKTIDENFGFSKAGFSIYKDFEVTGWPKYAIRRGDILLESGKLSVLESKGVSLRRNRWEYNNSN